MQTAAELTGKVAIVTGASRGIGRAIAVRLAQAQASVVVAYHQDERAAQETLQEVLQAGAPRAKVSRLEVVDATSCQELVQEISSAWGGVHVLVNNAGYFLSRGLLETSDEEWSHVMAVNLNGPLNMLRAVAPVMLKQRGGSVVNLSSTIAERGVANTAAYAAAKAGVLGLTRSAARELGSRNVRVNAIVAGVVDLRMLGEPDPGTDALRWARERTPLGRLGTPADIANGVLWLASDASSYVTGAGIVIDGSLQT